jgi:uncharacterized repeat protein (TIGR03803 family)
MRPPRLACLRKLNWGNSACALLLLCVTTAIALPAQTVTTLHSFDSTDGQAPELLVQATNGSLYATTAEAGANGYGTVFKIAPGGTFTLLDSFDATGEYPYGAPLVQDANGDFYGTLEAGGADLTLCGGSGCGTFFKMTAAGALTTLYNFCSHSNCTDGSAPLTGLALAPDGSFYGTTSAGGANCVAEGGCGTVFKITPGGTLTTLYSFCSKSDCTDGEFPTSWLIQAPDGVFYGTTFSGGSNCVADGGCGTVFKITPSGTLTTLYSFCAQSNCMDGSNPRGLIQAANGDFYGTTKLGGANGAGTIFKLTPSGTVTTVHIFGSTDNSGVVSLQATDGNFYGTTHAGGANNAGTIFKLTPSGTVTTLYSFCEQSSCTDGNAPVGLLQNTNGEFYGSTEAGGTSSACTGGCGTIYSLSVGLKPFVETQTTSGKEGAKIGILGQGFSSSSVVKFGGTKATTTVPSGTTFILATVPAVALTGSVTVATGATTLISSQIFKVTPTVTSFAPPSGPVGTTVTIRGTGLKQTTEVTFNGKSATITPDSDTQLTADVPSGATTGKIVVTTKGGSATSATSFTVN